MRALIYARVSLDQAEGRSVVEQETECRAWAAREGWTVTRVITETGSASRYARSTGARTRWPDLVAAVASGEHDILLTWEASRATRQLGEYAQLRNLCDLHGVLWGYSGRTYDLRNPSDRFATGLDALMSEDASARTSERVQRAVRARAREGRPHGKLPYGYRREYDPTTGRLLQQVPDEDQAPVVREIYARVLAGDSLYGIANDLTARQVTPPRPPTKRHDRKQEWLSITLRRIATSPTYAARRTHRGVVVGDADWEPLVPLEDWERAVAILTDPARATRTGDSTSRHLLAGIARCGKTDEVGAQCGAELRHLRNRGRWGTYGCARQGCYGVAIAAPHLDAFVRDVVLTLLEQHRDALAAGVADTGHDTELHTARTQLQDLRARLAGFVTEAGAGRLSPATLSAVEADLAPRIATAERDVRRLLLPRTLPDLTEADPATWWDSPCTDIVARRQLVRELVTVTVRPAGRGNWGKRGLDDTRVDVTPRW
ncbi:recombinase family protein [Ornithinimicrobium cerasi]|uniref:recombinase family protein n=1 Tax=Ornithinimicrobium cerasi TaxID=2248773 RepID=UPI001379E5BE|nr:recombinase family protein [Ornithinimicrobium cerasi]